MHIIQFYQWLDVTNYAGLTTAKVLDSQTYFSLLFYAVTGKTHLAWIWLEQIWFSIIYNLLPKPAIVQQNFDLVCS